MPKKSPKLNLLPRRNRRLIIAIFGFCLAVFGVYCIVFWEPIFKFFLQKQLSIRPNTKIFEVWRKPPMKLALDVYFFNWTNPQDFQNHSIKPILQELGPYRFIEKPEKVDIKWHPENASITYRKKSQFYFDAATSKGSLDDRITSINILAVALSNKAKKFNSIRRTIINIALRVYQDGIILRKSVREMLFEGYNDLLMNVAEFIPSSIIDVFVPFDRFGYCYPRNGSSAYQGVFNVHTGAKDLSQLGQMNTWNYRNQTKTYPGKCGKVRGSAGEFQPPNLQKNGSVDLFLPELCRSIPLEYVEPTESKGVPGYRYTAGLKAIDNGTLYPENACYCNGECVPSGLINITECWFDASIFLSYPHFYQADPYYAQQVVGMKPEKNKHESYMVLEPKTGATMELAGRFQANVLVRPMSELNMFRNTREIFFPLFWFEEAAIITADNADDLKLVHSVYLGGQIFGGICAVVGLLIVVWQPIVFHFHRRMLQQIRINDLGPEDQQQHSSSCIKAKNDGVAAAGGEVLPESSPLLAHNAELRPNKFLLHSKSMESGTTTITTADSLCRSEGTCSETNRSSASLNSG